MIKGVGLDVCQISRMKETLKNEHFLTRFFSPEEQAYLNSRGAVRDASAAGMFAAKEAFVKALQTGFTSLELQDIAVVHKQSGAPEYHLTGHARHALQAFGANRAFLSITHDADIAAATCILEGD